MWQLLLSPKLGFLQIHIALAVAVGSLMCSRMQRLFVVAHDGPFCNGGCLRFFSFGCAEVRTGVFASAHCGYVW